jgi:hypothetical protein
VDSPGVWPFQAYARGECCIIPNEDQVLVGDVMAHTLPCSHGVKRDLNSFQAIYSTNCGLPMKGPPVGGPLYRAPKKRLKSVVDPDPLPLESRALALDVCLRL